MISYNWELKDCMSEILQIWDNFYTISLQVLTNKKQIEWYIKIYGPNDPRPLAFSELWYIQNPGIFKAKVIFRTLLYPKLWYIQNQRHIQDPGLFRTLGYSVPEPYSEPCQTSTMEHFEKQLTAIITVASYNYFQNISFSCPLVHEKNMICLMQV